ncbi:Cellobiose dehydrogenase [Lachnellula suecica]|uniref:Cellobiose dehydrogenase n=1 Tax=Lachnellula suecica TaxID=602035 RepID=A0A8T9CG25_9HELO|nr:Cellobiose dehydrogenase [Lachnellula suecica]
MKTTNFLSGVVGIAFYFISAVLAQDFATHAVYKEPNTGITFFTSNEADGAVSGDGEFSMTSVGGFTFGLALPQNALTVDSYEYIGLIIGSTPNGTGWTGIVQGDNTGAGMPNHLMLIAWPSGNGNQVLTSFRYAPAYQNPVPYLGTASISQIYSNVNATHFTLVYRCQRCLIFDDPTQAEFNTSTSNGRFEQGWAQAVSGPSDKTNAQASIDQHDNGMGEFAIPVASATQASYSQWATLTATETYTTGTATATATTSFSSVPVPTGTTYDYVVIGGGAGGIPIADKLSESGKSVLLIDKGVASSVDGVEVTIRPESGWLDGTNLTWFDVPGECNRIWNGGSAGVSCTDTDQMAGCVLGGGTAVNAGLWWNANPTDWDVLFPTGWKSTDMAPATKRVFQRIPGTDHPSLDGKLYLQSGFDVLQQGLANAKWTNVTANNSPGLKNRTYAHTAYMYSHGERGGPMASYLVTANSRKNFHMWLNTSVERINRIGGHGTSLDLVATNNGGYVGTLNLTAITGRVIIAGGAFGTSKLLFRSGIGPTDQLQVVNSSTDAGKMTPSTNWINLPVGYNLGDHLNTDTVISHPNISYYDWVAAWDTPIATDASNYLKSRIGPLAQAAPDIGPMMWEEITGPDGIVRQFQWTSRVEGSGGVANGDAMTLSLYLGRGQVSRGRTTIAKGLNMVVSTIPWGDVNDLATVATAIDHMKSALLTVNNLTYSPLQIPLTYANIGARRANHWLGTAKMGTDSGLTSGGTSVVDTNTKVYGTDNIFVVDASIFPGMPSTNPSALIVAAAEKASEKILALKTPTGIAKFSQCGGSGYTGDMVCASGSTCTYANAYYSQCL